MGRFDAQVGYNKGFLCVLNTDKYMSIKVNFEICQCSTLGTMESAGSMVLEIPYTERPSVLEVAYGYSTSTGGKRTENDIEFL